MSVNVCFFCVFFNRRKINLIDPLVIGDREGVLVLQRTYILTCKQGHLYMGTVSLWSFTALLHLIWPLFCLHVRAVLSFIYVLLWQTWRLRDGWETEILIPYSPVLSQVTEILHHSIYESATRFSTGVLIPEELLRASQIEF